VDEWAAGNTGGPFFKIERAYEFSDGGSLVGDPEPRLQNYATVGGAKKLEKIPVEFPLSRRASPE